ncbi:ATP-binding cassette domain-containing protein [Rhodococcus sp. NPDC127530]|uniref:ATP-binding cassette domain-containing protein n=1 Tax=unclassified Rhodococcus (in: high G+C Gram-positive bacteria) TaxID=192944 RepID=UPI00363F7FF6
MSTTARENTATSTSVLDGAVVLQNVTKTFPGVRALGDVHFDTRPGEVHALVGENGSGKSTLIKVASGVLVPDSGTVTIGGSELRGRGTGRARRLGLMTAYQDTSLVTELSVADNVALSFTALGLRRPDDVSALLSDFDLPFGPTDKVQALGPGARQLLEVARAMCHKPAVLMLDEPTAALDMRFASKLEDLIRRTRDEGVAIVYVSHRLEEVRRLVYRLTVIRDGEIQGTHDTKDWDVDRIVELMVGAPTDLEFPTRNRVSNGPTSLKVDNLTGDGFGPVSISVAAGEIVGVAGAEGNGQRAFLRGLIGVGRRGGSVEIDGAAVKTDNPSSALQSGISFQSGDRAGESMFGALSVMDNSTAQYGAESGPAGLATAKRLQAAFARVSSSLGIVAASPHQPIGALSGGNQQKAILARPALRRPKVLVVDEPTQGVDARARVDIYDMLSEAAESGIGVLVNSSDSSELAGLCDRVYVMSRGAVVEELMGTISEADIVRGFVGAVDVDKDQESGPTSGSFFSRLRARTTSSVSIVALVFFIAVVALYAGFQSPIFWTGENLSNLLLLCLPLTCVAIGQQFALLPGGFDISVGSTMSLTVVVASMTLTQFGPSSLLLSLVMFVLVAVLVGGFNAIVVGVLKVNAIVATIATLGIVQGIAVVLRPEPAGLIAPELAEIFSLGIGFVPTAFIVVVVIVVLLEVWLHRSPSGLAIRAVGFNAESSARVGVQVSKIKAGALMFCAGGAVVGGIFLASQAGVGSNAVGASFALPCFAACFLGGAVLSGGRGSFAGALLGAFLLSLLDNIAPLLGIPDPARQVIYGVIMLVAVSAYAASQRKSR